MALKFVAYDAFSDSERGFKKLSDLLNDDPDEKNLSYIFSRLYQAMAHLNNSKEKWRKSDLVKEADLIRAVATEAGLSSWESPDALTV